MTRLPRILSPFLKSKSSLPCRAAWEFWVRAYRSRAMKNRLSFALFLLSVVMVFGGRVPSAAQKASGQTGANGAPPLVNPLKVALLRWYKANTVFTMFPVGNQPYGIAFDGASIWTANSGDNTVTKLRASDGTVLGTFSSGGSVDRKSTRLNSSHLVISYAV